MAKILNSIHPDDDLHYEKMKLDRHKVALWEDGLRTNGKKGEQRKQRKWGSRRRM